MTIEMVKFGQILSSRPVGRESLLAIRPTLPKDPEEIILDFSGVNVLTPSFADEFVTPLTEQFQDNIKLVHTQENITVQKTLQFLSENWKGVIME